MTNHHKVASVWDVLGGTASPAAEMRIRSELMTTLSDIVHKNNMTPSDAAQLFGVPTAAIQDLNRGKMNQFSLHALVGMAATAGMAPSIKVAQPKLSPLRKPSSENRQSPAQLSANATLSVELQSQPNTKFPALSEETRTHVTTEHAAWLLGRACQTLRVWACYESRGPLRLSSPKRTCAACATLRAIDKSLEACWPARRIGCTNCSPMRVSVWASWCLTCTASRRAPWSKPSSQARPYPRC